MRIDDFGKGYSSLHYLKRLPVDTLKMDQAFVTGIGQNPADTAIIRAIVNLGRALDLQIIAEGVETADQLAELRTLGCDFAQGYFFAPPQTGEQTSALLSHRPRW